MSLQIINSTKGQPEYILLPISVYENFRTEIDTAMLKLENEYTPFQIEDYIDNPIATMRIKANLTQAELANIMGVTQAYISKLENQNRVSAKIIAKVQKLLS